VLGGGDRVRLGGVGDHDAALRGGLHIDVVDPRPRPPDHLEPLGSLDQLGVEVGSRADQDRVELADSLTQLAPVPPEAELDLEALAQ
jgi:hypothetical protein